MMSYKIFKEVVLEILPDFLGGKYKNYNIETRVVIKNYQQLDGISIVPPGAADIKQVLPTVYLNGYYQQHMEGENWRKLTKDIADAIEAANENVDMEIISDTDIETESAKKNIVGVLINTKENKKLIKSIPSVSFLDLSIVFRWIVREDVEGLFSINVTNDIMENIGINKEQLYQLAIENTRRIAPPRFQTLKESMVEMLKINGLADKSIPIAIPDMSEDRAIYVISNERRVNGGFSMVYEDVLYTLSEKVGSDLLIVPRGVHEVLAVSSKRYSKESLSSLIAGMDMLVKGGERLSDQMYQYDRDIRLLCCC